MPYAWQNKHIKLGVFDRRRSSLTDEDKENIRRLHADGMATRAIARLYASKCSRATIIFIIYPERLIRVREARRKAQVWKKYSNRKQLTIAKRKWQSYKQQLIKANKIS